MKNIYEKLNKIEENIKEKKNYEKKIDLELRVERKQEKKNINKIWKKELENNEDFIGSLKKMLSTFERLDQNLKYKYTFNSKDDGFGSFQIFKVEFTLGNICVSLLIPIIKITNIQIYVDWNIDARAINRENEHLKSFKLHELSKAKDFYLNKILEIFEQLQE